MYKVILVGLVGNHHSLYGNLIKLLSSQFDKITFLSTFEIVGQLDYDIDSKIVNILYSKGKFANIIVKNLHFINEHDIVFLDEYYGPYRSVVRLNFKCRIKVLLVHNVNKWLNERFRYDLRVPIYHFFMKRFFNQFDAYIAMGPNIKLYLESLKSDKPVFFFPFDQSSDDIMNLIKQEKEEKDTIDIVLPGMISEERRNYKEFIDVLEKYYNDFPGSKIRIKLLGKIVSIGEAFVSKQCDRINNMYGKRVFYWQSFIPSEEYEHNIIDADFILSNVHIFNTLEDRTEIYGITKESGISFIVYKYAKPAIVPEIQNILLGFNDQLIKFNSYEELYGIFKNIDNNKIKVNKLIRNAVKNRERFNDRVKNENLKIMKYLTQ